VRVCVFGNGCWSLYTFQPSTFALACCLHAVYASATAAAPAVVAFTVPTQPPRSPLPKDPDRTPTGQSTEGLGPCVSELAAKSSGLCSIVSVSNLVKNLLKVIFTVSGQNRNPHLPTAFCHTSLSHLSCLRTMLTVVWIIRTPNNRLLCPTSSPPAHN
jgi:hypothetical protein